MNWKYKIAILLLVGALFWSCQPKVSKPLAPPTAPTKALRIPALPDSALVIVDTENVRATPNGKIVGKLYNDDMVYPEGRVGNWIRFHNFYYREGYVWGPSIGLPYLNLYDPRYYFDPRSQQFYSLDYIKKFLGSEGEVQKVNTEEYRLVFRNLGLGSHTEEVWEVTTRTTERVEHQLVLYVRKQDGYDRIYQMRIDFYRPVKGVKEALKKCGLDYREPSRQSDEKVVWNPGVLIPGLQVELERKDWQSDIFSTVWYKLPGVK